MSFIHVVGRVTTELELKVSLKGTPYVRFSLEERTVNAPAQLFQVWAYGWEAEHLVKRDLRPGCILEVNGPLLVEEYTAKDGYTPGIRLKIIYRDGRLILRQKPNSNSQRTSTTHAVSPASESTLPPEGMRIDGEREPLPE